MSTIYSLLESIFQTNGSNSKLWDDLKNIIKNKNEEIESFCFLIKNRINKGNKSDILLSLNILDFAVDSGRMLLWTKIDSSNFLSCIINILKTRLDEDLQSVALYLIQKWAIKFKDYPSIQNCYNTYNTLKKNNINFPNNIKITYKNYLNKNTNNNKNYIDNNDIVNKINNNKILMRSQTESKNISIRKSRIPSNPYDYLKNINLDLNSSSYEKKYTRLVNKLYDWTHLIQEINVLINNNKHGKNNTKLKSLCDDLKRGNEQLIETIEGPKLKDEKLMEISLNVSEDIIMTLDRYERSKSGMDPGPFLTSFLRDDNPYFNKGLNPFSINKVYDPDALKLLSQNPQENIKKLGFGDTIKTRYAFDEVGNLNINNSHSSLNGLFGEIDESKALNMSKANNINNNYFTTMSNSNINMSLQNTTNNPETNNAYPNYSQFSNMNKNVNDSNIKIIQNSSKGTKNEEVLRSNIVSNDIYGKNNNINDKYYKSHMFPNSRMNINDTKNMNNIYNAQVVMNNNPSIK